MTNPIDYERIAIPPHGGVRIVCQNWPTCGCGGDCTEPRESPRVRKILIGLMVAVAAIGAGLVYAGTR